MFYQNAIQLIFPYITQQHNYKYIKSINFQLMVVFYYLNKNNEIENRIYLIFGLKNYKIGTYIYRQNRRKK